LVLFTLPLALATGAAVLVLLSSIILQVTFAQK
jgi:hypothetical protein